MRRIKPAQHHYRGELPIDPHIVTTGAEHENRFCGGTKKSLAAAFEPDQAAITGRPGTV